MTQPPFPGNDFFDQIDSVARNLTGNAYRLKRDDPTAPQKFTEFIAQSEQEFNATQPQAAPQSFRDFERGGFVPPEVAEARLQDPDWTASQAQAPFVDPDMDPNAFRNVMFGLNPIGGSAINLLTPREGGGNRVFTPQVPEGFFGSEENLGRLFPVTEAAREITSPFDVLTSAALAGLGPAASAALQGTNRAGRVAAKFVDPITRGGLGRRLAAETGVNLGATFGALEAPKLLPEDAPMGAKIAASLAGGLAGGVGSIGAINAPRIGGAAKSAAGDAIPAVRRELERIGNPPRVSLEDIANESVLPPRQRKITGTRPGEIEYTRGEFIPIDDPRVAPADGAYNNFFSNPRNVGLRVYYETVSGNIRRATIGADGTLIPLPNRHSGAVPNWWTIEKNRPISRGKRALVERIGLEMRKPDAGGMPEDVGDVAEIFIRSLPDEVVEDLGSSYFRMKAFDFGGAQPSAGFYDTDDGLINIALGALDNSVQPERIIPHEVVHHLKQFITDDEHAQFLDLYKRDLASGGDDMVRRADEIIAETGQNVKPRRLATPEEVELVRNAYRFRSFDEFFAEVLTDKVLRDIYERSLPNPERAAFRKILDKVKDFGVALYNVYIKRQKPDIAERVYQRFVLGNVDVTRRQEFTEGILRQAADEPAAAGDAISSGRLFQSGFGATYLDDFEKGMRTVPLPQGVSESDRLTGQQFVAAMRKTPRELSDLELASVYEEAGRIANDPMQGAIGEQVLSRLNPVISERVASGNLARAEGTSILRGYRLTEKSTKTVGATRQPTAAPRGAVDLNEKLAPDPTIKNPDVFSPQGQAQIGEQIPRYWYHHRLENVPIPEDGGINATRIRQPQAADAFRGNYAEGEYIWLSPQVIRGRTPEESLLIDISKLDNNEIRLTGQAEGNILHRGKIPKAALVDPPTTQARQADAAPRVTPEQQAIIDDVGTGRPADTPNVARLREEGVINRNTENLQVNDARRVAQNHDLPTDPDLMQAAAQRAIERQGESVTAVDKIVEFIRAAKDAVQISAAETSRLRRLGTRLGRRRARGISDPARQARAFRSGQAGQRRSREVFEPLIDPETRVFGEVGSRLPEDVSNLAPTEAAARIGITGDDLRSLYDAIAAKWPIGGGREWAHHNAQVGLTKALLGDVPTDSELRLLREVFGKKIVKELVSRKPGRGRELLFDLVFLLGKTLRSSFDASAPLRQLVVFTVNPRRIKQSAPTIKRMFQVGFTKGDPQKLADQFNDELVNPAKNRHANRLLKLDVDPLDTDVPGGNKRIILHDVSETGAIEFTDKEEIYMSSISAMLPEFGSDVRKLKEFKRKSLQRLGAAPTPVRLGIKAVTYPIRVVGRGIRRSELMFGTAINQMRMRVAGATLDNWDEAAREASRQGVPNPVEQESVDTLIDAVNVFTGRGNLPAFLTGRQGSRWLAAIFWAPKLAVSRFQAPLIGVRGLGELGLSGMARVTKASPDSLLSRVANSPGARARKEMAKDLVAFVTTGTTILAALEKFGVAEVETDPRSSDFGKGRIGNTRFDFWGGYQQPARYVWQAATGTQKRLSGENKGELVRLGAFNATKEEEAARAKRTGKPTPPPDRMNLLFRFVQSKASPGIPALIANEMRGQTFVGDALNEQAALFGEDFGPTVSVREREAIQQLLPLFGIDIVEAIEEQGVILGLALGGSAGLGVGTATFDTEGEGLGRFDNVTTPAGGGDPWWYKR